MVQGGVSALSRSVYASMIPEGRSTEFFGFYTVSGRFGGIAGPLVFLMVGLSLGASRWGILSWVGFFAVGAALLRRVDIGAGQKLAKEEDAAMRADGGTASPVV